MWKILLIAAGLAVLGGCASPKLGNVLPMEGGVYQVDGLAANSDDAMKSALYTAEKSCSAQNKRHVIVGQKTQYKGVLSQDTNRTVENVAQTVATMTGKWIPTLSSDDDYRITLTFKCE